MFDMFGNLEEHQEALQQKLKELEVEEASAAGEVSIRMNGLKQVTNIKVDFSKVDREDSEHLEDLLIVTFNEVSEMISEREAEITQTSLKDMLPPGMENLFG